VKEIVEEIARWAERFVGPWGPRILAFVVALLAYGVVMFVVSTFRNLLDKLARPNPEEPRGLTTLRALLQLGVAVALLVWLVNIAINDYGDWLGIDILKREP
jgi:hypothetical protein